LAGILFSEHEVGILKKYIPLLTLLSSGEFQSGQALADQLSISRATVSSWVTDLEQYGLEINKVKGRGYRLVRPIHMLNAEHVRSLISEGALARLKVVEFVADTDSTNGSALKANYDVGDWKLFSTEYQNQGRGRRGKSWLSPPCNNLLFSLANKDAFGSNVLYMSSIIAGVAIAKALRECTALPVKLKWPNDLYIEDRKLAGILCELQGSPLDESLLVIGVGLNITSFPERVDIKATSLLEEKSVTTDRNQLLAILANAIVSEFENAKKNGTEAVVEQWAAFDLIRGRKVSILQGSNSLTGIASGIDDKGQLLLEGADGSLISFNGGEVSVRW